MKDLSNCITYDIKSYNNIGLMMVWAEICLFMVGCFKIFTSFVQVFIDIYIICKLDNLHT